MNNSSTRFFLIALVFLIILGARFLFFYKDQPKLRGGEEISLETTLLSEPKVSIRNQIFPIVYKNQRVMVFAPVYPEIHYGDRAKITGSLASKVINNKENFSINAKIELKKDNSDFILAVSSAIRQKIISFYQQSLNQNFSGLMLGIVFGIKEYIPSSFVKDLKTAGVMHVIAASGMNVTLVAGFLSSIFLLFFKRQIALVISIVGIIIYAVLAGLEPSIIRASIMGILVFTASIFGRQTWPLYGLLLAGFVMLMWDPNLLNDIGFQLSFLATIGLLYMKPFFKNKILDGFQTTIFAQAATLPILVSNFGTYSLWSIVVNSLILWTIPLLMVIGGVSAVISFIIFPIAKILLYLSLPLLIFFESVVRFFSGLSGTIKIENLSWQIVLGYYCLLASFILARNK